jgi:hypothetical protein
LSRPDFPADFFTTSASLASLHYAASYQLPDAASYQLPDGAPAWHYAASYQLPDDAWQQLKLRIAGAKKVLQLRGCAFVISFAPRSTIMNPQYERGLNI